MRKSGFFSCLLMVLLLWAFLPLAVWGQDGKSKEALPEARRSVLTVLPFGKSPVIDGQIASREWEDAAMHWGGVSKETQMLAQRRVDYRIGAIPSARRHRYRLEGAPAWSAARHGCQGQYRHSHSRQYTFRHGRFNHPLYLYIVLIEIPP